MKLPFKAKPEDTIHCPDVGHEVNVDAYCHGWALRDELCHDAENCEPYLEYAECRLKELQGKLKRVPLPPKVYIKLEKLAKVKGTTPDNLASKIILKEVIAHGKEESR